MKAEHRKELQTNYLADRMGRMVQGMKGGSQTTSIIGWVFLVLAVGTFTAWYFAKGSDTSQADLWVQLDGNNDPTDLERIANTNPGTIIARDARAREARVLLQQGMDRLYPDQRLPSAEQIRQRAEAIKNLEHARTILAALSVESADNLVAKREALLGNARVEESLMAVPQENDATKMIGDKSRAIQLYRQFLEQTEPEGWRSRSLDEIIQDLEQKGTDRNAQDDQLLNVAKHVQELEKNGVEVATFYEDLNRTAATEVSRPH